MEQENPTAEVEQPIAEGAEPVVETTDAPAETDWDNALTKAFEANDVSETVVSDPAAPFPSEAEQVQAKDDTPDTDAPVADEPPDEEEVDAAKVIEAKGDPFSLNRKQLRQVESSLLTPLRNPDEPIENVVQALYEFHPQRAEAMFQHIVDEAARSHPNEWLEVLTGIEGITVDKVRELNSRPEKAEPQAESPDTAEKYLTDLYGEDWKDPKNDEYLLESDVNTARLARKVLEMESQDKQRTTAEQSKLDELTKQLEQVKSEAEEFKKHKQAVFEKDRIDLFTETVQTYQDTIEQAVLPKLFADTGLAVTEQDTDFVKGGKEFVQSLFKNGHFAEFVTEKFSGQQEFARMRTRIEGLLYQASEREALAKTSPLAEANKLKAEANALKTQAKNEEAAVKAMTSAAAKEFLQTVSWVTGAMERISELERNIARSPRREIIGNTATSTDPDAWKQRLKESEDKWNMDIISERLAGAAR